MSLAELNDPEAVKAWQGRIIHESLYKRTYQAALNIIKFEE
jgi:hypothetical protein